MRFFEPTIPNSGKSGKVRQLFCEIGKQNFTRRKFVTCCSRLCGVTASLVWNERVNDIVVWHSAYQLCHTFISKLAFFRQSVKTKLEWRRAKFWSFVRQ